jgi:hypothetical protein
MDTTKIRNAALAASAVAAALVAWAFVPRAVETWKIGVVEASAQEASAVAAEVVQAEMAPAVQELGQIKDLLRRQEDRDAFRACMEYAHQDQPVEVRNQTCERESNHRWAVWAWEDCELLTPGECGDKP